MASAKKTQVQKPQEYGPNGLAIAALVTGILGMGVIPLVLGILGLKQAQKEDDNGKGMAIAGIVLGSLVILFSIIWFILIIIGFAVMGIAAA